MIRGGAAVGRLRFWIAKTRRPAEAGQDSFTWPRTRDAASHRQSGWRTLSSVREGELAP
jgi:hypothetical protein